MDAELASAADVVPELVPGAEPAADVVPELVPDVVPVQDAELVPGVVPVQDVELVRGVVPELVPDEVGVGLEVALVVAWEPVQERQGVPFGP